MVGKEATTLTQAIQWRKDTGGVGVFEETVYHRVPRDENPAFFTGPSTLMPSSCSAAARSK